VFSKTNVLLTADLPEIKLFGDSGPVFKPGQLAWSSGSLTGFTPKVPSLPNFKTVNLTAKVPRIDLAIALPSEIPGFAGSLVASVGDIALDGDVDFATGAFSLAASMSNDTLDAAGAISRAKSGDPYKYNLTGKIKKAIAMNSSVKLTALDFTFGNTTAGGEVTFAGTGGVEVTLPDTTVLSMNGALTYKSATDYSLAISVVAVSTTNKSDEVDATQAPPMKFFRVAGAFCAARASIVIPMGASYALGGIPLFASPYRALCDTAHAAEGYPQRSRERIWLAQHRRRHGWVERERKGDERGRDRRPLQAAHDDRMVATGRGESDPDRARKRLLVLDPRGRQVPRLQQPAHVHEYWPRR